jgi:hypothetical protein
MLGFAILSIVLHLLFGILIAIYSDFPVTKIRSSPSKLMIVFRAIFTFGVSMAAIWVSSTSGIIAGMSAIFPAIFTTTMVSLWVSHGPEVVQSTGSNPLTKLMFLASSMMLGGLSVSVYALVFASLRPLITLIPAVIVAYLAAFISTTLPTVQILRKVLQSKANHTTEALLGDNAQEMEELDPENDQ